jgi:uncharacterized protein YodC (DUF2158 family)
MAKTIIEADFKVGDVVKLKSGGPEMTVKYIVGTDKAKDFDFTVANYIKNDVVCRWFENDNLKDAVFSPETLIHVS